MRKHLIAALATMLAVGLATSACETPTDGQPRPAQPGATMWELIQDSTSEDGTMSLPASLLQFSYMFKPLPGVTMPPAKPAPPGFAVSGTSAINAMLSHWSELNVEQRQAVATVARPARQQPPKLRSAADPAKDKALDILRQQVKDLTPKIASRVNVKIPDANVIIEDVDPGPTRAWTFGTASTWFPSKPENTQANGCDIHVPPKTWRQTSDPTLIWVRVTLAHELFHCAQVVSSPSIATYTNTPKWINDGWAEFAAIDMLATSHSPTDNTWTDYLENDFPLYKRADGAAGWWFHLQHMGRDPWALVPPLWKAGKVDTFSVYTTMGGDGDDVYDTWAASRLRETRFGNDWEVHGVDVPAVDATKTPDLKPSVIDVPIQNGMIDQVGGLEARVAKLSTPDDLTGIVRVSAANPIRLHDNASFEDPHITEGDYCLGPNCTCPKNTERAGENIRPVTGPLWLAVPGGEAGNSVRSDVMTLEEYCKKKRPDRKKPVAHPKHTWSHAHAPGRNPNGPQGEDSGQPGPKPASVGDPHLASLDGYSFDFQTSGEFTLVRSDSGDLEVQTRQQPRIKFDGKESDSASMNTAVAAGVVGDRVAFYARQDRPEVRINGTSTPVDSERKLPKGGTIRPVEAGYAVRWPDGSEMWAINAGAPDSLTVLFGPAESRKGTLHGLLGQFEGKAGAALFDRAGHRYEKPSFDDLYKKIGDSWRIKQSDSLFDYQPGQSTDTFTRKDLPAKPLTLADLSPQQRAAGEKACTGVTDALREQCIFDVAVSGNDKLAVGYRTLDKLRTVGGGGLALGKPVGPQRLEAGQQQTFTIDSDADALYFASDADCTKPTSATVYWRITAPDGHDTLQVPMCADAGRQTSKTKGTWKIDVWVAPGADQGGIFALHVAAAGPLQTFDIGLPRTVDGSLRGAGGEDRYRFTASAGDKVTLTSKSTCDSDRTLYWGLESPDGNRITLRTRACENLGQQAITVSGTWSVGVYNNTDDESPHGYSFTVARP
jgi:hypothetical protein